MITNYFQAQLLREKVHVAVFPFILSTRLYEQKLSRKEGHPPSRVSISDCLYENKFDPLSQANGACAFSEYLVLTVLTRLGKPKCLHGEALAQIGG